MRADMANGTNSVGRMTRSMPVKCSGATPITVNSIPFSRIREPRTDGLASYWLTQKSWPSIIGIFHSDFLAVRSWDPLSVPSMTLCQQREPQGPAVERGTDGETTATRSHYFETIDCKD